MDKLAEVRTDTEFISYRAHPYYRSPELILRLSAIGGMDIGRAVHPSHLAILLSADLGRRTGYIQIASVWLPVGTPYTQQVGRVKVLMRDLNCKQISYDATRGELEALREQGVLKGFKPVILSAESKKRMAGRLLTFLEQGKLILLPDERQRRSLLQVNNMLQAEESQESHGDCFWSLALALEATGATYSAVARLIQRGRYG